MQLQVETCVGLHGQIEPHAFLLGGRRLQVMHIIDRWLAQDHGYFKLRASDDAVYILRLDEQTGLWELTLFQVPQSPG